MQSIDTVATCMFYKPISHTFHISALGVIAQQYLISFETVANFAEPEFHFFQQKA